MPAMIRTAFNVPDRRRWTGGYQYFINLFRVLSRYGHGQIQPVAFVPEGIDDEQAVVLNECGVDITPDPIFSPERAKRRLVDALATGRDHVALRCYRERGIEVIFESAMWHGWRFPLPTVAWLPDFQHRRLPGMFGPLAWLQRELGFRAEVASAEIVMLSSESARADCESLYPGSRTKIEVVPFAVEPGPEAFTLSVAEVRQRYGLDTPYFYLPNQFWRHKNHTLIVEALRQLVGSGIDATVVASGSQIDTRHPGVVRNLLEQVGRAGLESRFRFLQFVPRPDVYALMRGAVALLNPSLFEGWSTTVEEAKAMGVPLALSDIAVHREQAGDAAYYFDPRSPDAAAGALAAVLENEGRREGMLKDESHARNRSRLLEYARKLETVIMRAAGAAPRLEMP